ncbi:hypothetical protein ACS0TY_029075 [Phlomoides rotata]
MLRHSPALLSPQAYNVSPSLAFSLYSCTASLHRALSFLRRDSRAPPNTICRHVLSSLHVRPRSPPSLFPSTATLTHNAPPP